MTTRVLLLSLSGIGNFLMQLPTITALKAARPDWEITVWVAPRGTKALATATGAIDHVIEAPIRRSLLRNLLFVRRLARRQFDIGVMLSPGQLWKGSAYIWLAGIPQRLGHRYPHLGNPHSSFLLTKTIPEQEGLHDIEQNLRLLQLLDIPQSSPAMYQFTPPAAHERRASELLGRLQLAPDAALVGLHPGSAADFTWKRWPLERFGAVGRKLIADGSHILIFGGPDERSSKRELRRLLGTEHSTVIDTDLLTTAALARHCRLFIANDSGLMHLAAAVGTKTYGLFGPTDEAATGPRGRDSHSIRAQGTEPIYNTETNYDLGTEPHHSLLALTPEVVLDSISR